LANDATISVAEDIAFGTTLVAVPASDANAGDVLSYAITAGNGARLFAIDQATGAVSLSSGQKLDYETATQHLLTITVTDQLGLSDSAAVTINVTDVAEERGNPGKGNNAGANAATPSGGTIDPAGTLSLESNPEAIAGSGSEAFYQNDVYGNFSYDIAPETVPYETVADSSFGDLLAGYSFGDVFARFGFGDLLAGYGANNYLFGGVDASGLNGGLNAATIVDRAGWDPFIFDASSHANGGLTGFQGNDIMGLGTIYENLFRSGDPWFSSVASAEFSSVPGPLDASMDSNAIVAEGLSADPFADLPTWYLGDYQLNPWNLML
jgi:hypothetical protein